MTDIDLTRIRHAGIGVKWLRTHPEPKPPEPPPYEPPQPVDIIPPQPEFPPLPTKNIKTIDERVAETEVFRNQVSKFTLQVMRDSIRGSARDLGDSFDSQLPTTKTTPEIRQIQELVASHFGISIINMISHRRIKNIIRPRQIAMYLCNELTSRTLGEIGRKFGGKDHTTIMHSSRKIAALIETDDMLAREIAMLKEMLSS